MIPTLWGDTTPTTTSSTTPSGKPVRTSALLSTSTRARHPTPSTSAAGFPAEDNAAQLPGAMGIYVSEVMWWLYRPLTFMIWGGVFERFPKLKAMIVEGGTMFMLPPWLRLMDFQYNEGEISAKLGDFKSHLSMAPSELLPAQRGHRRLLCASDRTSNCAKTIGLEKHHVGQ